MKTNELIKILDDPNIFEINRVTPSSTFATCGEEISLDGTWGFKFFDQVENRDENFHVNEITDEFIDIPSNIELKGYGLIHYVNTQYPWDGNEDVKVGKSPWKINYCSQFTKTVYIESAGQYIIDFHGVESAFNVWVNGQHVGYATDSFTTNSFDISSYLNKGDNIIAVEVYKYSASSWLNDQDFWRLSGIFRSVKIRPINDQTIFDISIDYDLDILNSTAVVDITFVKKSEFNIDLEVEFDGKIVHKCSSNSNMSFNLANLMLWNSETPHLYNLKFISNDLTYEKKIGFRKVEIIDKVLYLNGKRLIFKGMNRHEFSPLTGRAISNEETRKDLELLKEYNFNAVRTSHYPNNIEFYNLCDELGLYVIDEVNLETHGSWMVAGDRKDTTEQLPGNNSNYRENVLQRAVNMYERDKNNTSVIIWSLGNESYGGKTINEMYNYFKTADKHRLVHYEGIFWDRSYPNSSDFESQMYTSSEKIEDYFNTDFDKPFLLCEYSHAMGNSNGNFSDYIDLIDKYPSYCGGFIWEFMDQAIQIDGNYYYGGDFADRPTDFDFICDGLVGPNREITSELQYVGVLNNPLQILKVDNVLTITNKNTFKDYNELKIVKQKDGSSSIEVIGLDVNNSHDLPIEDGVHYQFWHDSKLLNEFSSEIIKPIINDNRKEITFIDGDHNFSVVGDEFSIMFSKVFNNVISLKIDGVEVYENIKSSFTPNFWRAPINNDIGANKHIENSIYKLLSYYQLSEIKSYKFEDETLQVSIKFFHPDFEWYKVYINYVITNEKCIVEVKDESNHLDKNYFNFGVKANLNECFKHFEFIGNGPFDSYSDRKIGLYPSKHAINISEQDGYIQPQEYGNKTDVSLLSINSNEVELMIESEEKFEFSLRQHSDIQLEHVRNKSLLVEESPFLRLNKFQVGVAGDDSWGSWVKDKYITKDKHLKFSIILRNCKNK